MAEKRLEDLAALETQLQVMEDLQLAKEDLEKLKSKRKNPQGLNTLKKPLLKADVLKNRCKSDIESLQKDIEKLEKSSTSNPHSGALYGIGFLLAIAAAIATLVFLIKKYSFNPIVHLTISGVSFIAVIVIVAIIDSLMSKKQETKNLEEIDVLHQRIKEKEAQLKVEQAKVAEEDRATTKAYQAKRQAMIDEANAEFTPLIEAKEKEIAALKSKYEEVAVIPSFTFSDREELKKIIWALKENYAESIPEARRWLKAEEENKKRQAEEERRRRMEEDRRREEERRRQEEERRRQEEERKRNSPGTVVVYATEDNKGKNAEVYVDGGYYGSINYVFGFTSFQLPAGPHNVSVIIKSQGYFFQSGVESFYLQGGEEVTLKFALLGYNNIRCYRS